MHHPNALFPKPRPTALRVLYGNLSILLAAWTIAVLSAGRPVAFAEEAAPRNIILVGWDGAQREHVMELLEQGKLPALKQLSTEGKLVNIDIRGTTDTKAGWSQILTGYDPDVTGVFGNSRYQPVPKGFSIFERMEEHFGPSNFVTVAVIGKKAHCGEIDPERKIEITEEEAAARPKQAGKGKRKRQKDATDDQENPPARKAAKLDPGARIVREEGKVYRVTPGKPYANMHSACDQWVFGLMKDTAVGTRAIEFLDRYKDKPFFFFVHFAEVDHSGHGHGENSTEYSDALISNDAWTGKILQKVKDLGLYDKTLVYVTADHGFDEGKTSHHKAPRVFLGTNDPKVMRAGDRADVSPTLYDRFGLDLSKFQPPLAGHSLLKPAE